MLTLYLVSFLMGLGLSIVWVVGGLDHLHVFGHGVAHHHHGPKRSALFNAAALTAFLTWFGGAGVAIHQLAAWTESVIAAAAVAAGVVGAGSVNRFLGALVARERPLESTPIVGTIGRVTSPIREGGTGEVVFVINGTRKVSAARSDDNTPVDKGSEVVIVRMDRGIAYVAGF